jgi:2-hydroxy-3-oxopropionate reductase
MRNIGFIGLGIMGKPMAANLVRKGCNVLAYDVNGAAVSELAGLGARTGTPESIGTLCDIVFTILPNGAIVKDVLFGTDGIAQRMARGSLVVDMSSVTPGDSKYCSDMLGKMGISFLDAPVSGGEPKAIDGTLSFMVGGDEAAFGRALPLLRMMGASAVRVGESGSGSVAKLANQIIVNTTIAIVSEAFVFAMKAGADPVKVFEAIRGGLAASEILERKIPMIVDRNFAPGGKISINLKDIRNVMQTAHEIDVPLPFTAQLLEIMQGLKIKGALDLDHSAIVQHFEQLAGVEVRKKEPR